MEHKGLVAEVNDIKRYNKNIYFPEQDKYLLVNFTITLNTILHKCQNKKVTYVNNWWTNLQTIVLDTGRIKKFIENDVSFSFKDIVEYYKDSNDRIKRVYYLVKYTDIVKILICVNENFQIVSVAMHSYDTCFKLDLDSYMTDITKLDFIQKQENIKVCKKDNGLCHNDCKHLEVCMGGCKLFQSALVSKVDSDYWKRCNNCLSFVG